MVTLQRAKQILDNDKDFHIIFRGLNHLSVSNKRKTYTIDEIYKQVIIDNYDISKNNLQVKVNMLTENGLFKIYMNRYGIAVSKDIVQKLI